MNWSLKEVRGHEGHSQINTSLLSVCLCLILVSVIREVSVVKDSPVKARRRRQSSDSHREKTHLWTVRKSFPFYLSNIKHHRGVEEDPLQLAPGWLGAGVSGSPSPGGSLSVWTWDKAEPRRSVPAGRCRAGWGPAGTPGGGSKGKPRGRRRSPSQRRERAWWRESRQRSRVRTADTHTEEFTDFKVTQQNKRTLQSLQ